MEFMVSDIGTVVSIIAIIASYFSGVRAGKVNEKRKEFNALAEPVLIALEEHCELFNVKALPHMYDPYFPNKEMASIRRRISERGLRKLDETFNRYLDLLAEIKKDPSPDMFPRKDQPEWIDRYPEALVIAKELMKIFKLR